MGKETPIVLGLVTEGNYMGCENKLDYPVIDRIVQKVYKRGQNQPKINKRGPNWTQSEETKNARQGKAIAVVYTLCTY